MAKNLRKVTFDESGNLINEDCAGVVTVYENPCGCGESSTSNPPVPPPVVWTESKCRVAKGVMEYVFVGLLPDILATARNNLIQTPFLEAAILDWLIDKGINSAWFPQAYAWVIQVRSLDTTAIDSAAYIPTAQCSLLSCLPESAQIDTAVVECWQSAFQGAKLSNQAASGMWEAAYGLLEWLPLELIQQAAFQASANGLGEADCTSCSQTIEPCGDSAGFSLVEYNYDDDELSGTPACYGNGAYTACSPYNSKEISGGSFTLTFGQSTCISQINFSVAGNSAVLWKKAQIKGVKADSSEVVFGVVDTKNLTKCQTSAGVSASLNLPNPVSVLSITVEATEWVGNKEAPLHLHCVRILQAAQVPAFSPTTPIATIHAAIASAPAGTYFYWEAGDYAINDLSPKAGDKHIALADGVRWYGAKKLPSTVWTWHASGVWKTTYTRTITEKATTMSGYAISGRAGWNITMYADSVVLEHVTALSGSGFTAPYQYCYDDQASTIYINFDPDQFDLIEVTDIRKAATLTNASFHLENIDVYGYASHLAEGAIHASNVKNASDMKIINCDFIRNSGDGIKVGRRALVRNVQCIENGNDGLTGQGYALADTDAGQDGAGDIVLDNLTCKRNNTKNVNVQWQGGNVKITRCNGLTVNNYVGEDAFGTDFWLDLSVKNAVFNTFVSRNAKARAGLFLEKSYSITGDDITIIRAQKTTTSHPWSGQLLVRSSRDINLTNIKILGADTGSGTSGGWIGVVEDNAAGNSDVYGTAHVTRNVVMDGIDVYTVGTNPQRGGLASNWTNPSQQWTDFWAGGNQLKNLRLHVPAGLNATSWYQHTGSNVPYSTIAAATAYYVNPTIDNAAVPSDLQ